MIMRPVLQDSMLHSVFDEPEKYHAYIDGKKEVSDFNHVLRNVF